MFFIIYRPLNFISIWCPAFKILEIKQVNWNREDIKILHPLLLIFKNKIKYKYIQDLIDFQKILLKIISHL